MSKAYKCDRCGILYGKNDKKLKDNMHITTNGGVELDLCEECVRGFNRWWNVEVDNAYSD